jgi:radical SAM protein with 4Fe4S-binding SPASM domain
MLCLYRVHGMPLINPQLDGDRNISIQPNYGNAHMTSIEMFRPSAPFYVQFEITGACNHRCFFCYNNTMHKTAEELNTTEAKIILDQMREAGVFSINFNGGEPLIRPDFFDLATHAKKLGFDIHLNTNATLIDEKRADKLAGLFPSICTSVLSADPVKHDQMTGVPGAYQRMYHGVALLLERGVKVEINVCTFRDNYKELFEIARSMARENVHVFCVTRYIMVSTEGQGQVLGIKETIAILDALELINKELPTYKEVKLPGPVPYCELPDNQTERLRKWNTPCQVGYGLCRISPQGKITPCPLSPYVIGDIKESDFTTLWQHERWNRFEVFGHLPVGCRNCHDLESCRGGCVGYDDCLDTLGRKPKTRKWSISGDLS